MIQVQGLSLFRGLALVGFADIPPLPSQNKAYGERADIWALGCLLYQMITLEPPFSTGNMLVGWPRSWRSAMHPQTCLTLFGFHPPRFRGPQTLAKKIVEGVYEPIPDDGDYSDLLRETVSACLTPDADIRPDILGVSLPPTHRPERCARRLV